MAVSSGFVNQAQLAQGVNDAIRGLNPREVVHVAYTIGHDSTEDPSIFFRIVLTDEASREDRLAAVTGRVTSSLFTSIRPDRELGTNAVFQFSQLFRAKNAKRS